jgi:hypothetical protein
MRQAGGDALRRALGREVTQNFRSTKPGIVACLRAPWTSSEGPSSDPTAARRSVARPIEPSTEAATIG